MIQMVKRDGSVVNVGIAAMRLNAILKVRRSFAACSR